MRALPLTDVEISNLEKRRFEENHLFEIIDNHIILKRLPLKKQREIKRKVRVSRAEYTFLQFNRIIRMWATINNKITLSELDILLYIYPLTVFKSKQFRQFQRELGIYTPRMFAKMIKNGWFIMWSKKGNTRYYVLSRKGNQLCARMHKMYMLEEEIPMGDRRNKSSGRKGEKHKVLMDLYKTFNQKIKENE